MRTPSNRLVNDYARKVVNEKILANEWVTKACARHLADLERGDDYPYRFDKVKAVEAINFIELLPHTKGRWAQKRERLILEPWQLFIVGCLFGWVHKETGLRRFREAYIEVPRKNGKSILAAAIGLYMFVDPTDFGNEVYAGATTEKQAWEVFRPARIMCKNTPDLCDYYGIEVNASNLLRLEDYSKFEPLIGNPGDGASVSLAIVDEFHEHADDRLVSTMQTGMGSRENPLLLIVTTAGSNMAGPCYEKRLEAQKVLSGVFEDERLFSLIYGLDKGDDFRDPENWQKANPNLGVSLSRDFIEAQVGSAIRTASKQNAIKTKHFNIWVGAKTAWLNMEQWRDAADPTLDISDFADCESYVGLDLAVRIDLAARVSLFWRDIDGVRHYYAFPHFYLPEDALDTAKNGTTYAGWAADGHIELMDGAEINLAQVQDDILALPETQTVRELVYDPWQATQIAQSVREEGIETVEYRNTVMNMSPPMRELEGALASGRFHHPDNPVFNWNASNVVAAADAKNNLFPRKETNQSHQKIDGIVATLFALGRAMHMQETGSFDDFLNNVISI